MNHEAKTNAVNAAWRYFRAAETAEDEAWDQFRLASDEDSLRAWRQTRSASTMAWHKYVLATETASDE